MSKRNLRLLLKIAVSAGLMYLVINKVAPDWEKCGGRMLAAIREGYGWLIAALSMMGIVLGISSLRWKTIMHAHNVAISFFRTFRFFLMGSFFSQFMPGGLAAGDAVRSYYVASSRGDKKVESVATIFVDRMVGVLGLLTVVVISLLLGGEHLGRSLVLLGLTVALVIGAALFFNKRVLRKVPFGGWIYEHLPYKERLLHAYEALRHYRNHKVELLTCWGLSVLIQLVLVCVAYCVGHSVGVRATALQYLLRIPLVGGIAAMPISFGNIGTAEAAYVLLFGLSPVVVAFALMMRMLWLFIGTAGGLTWWAEKGAISRRSFQKQEDASEDAPQKGRDGN
ncbi:flippase-like domain-containing protein [bacterium]|nr:flippase-like domain-containing protein [bacterium]